MTFYEQMLVSDGAQDGEAMVGVRRSAEHAVVTLDDPAKLNIAQRSARAAAEGDAAGARGRPRDPGDRAHRRGSRASPRAATCA